MARGICPKLLHALKNPHATPGPRPCPEFWSSWSACGPGCWAAPPSASWNAPVCCVSARRSRTRAWTPTIIRRPRQGLWVGVPSFGEIFQHYEFYGTNFLDFLNFGTILCLFFLHRWTLRPRVTTSASLVGLCYHRTLKRCLGQVWFSWHGYGHFNRGNNDYPIALEVLSPNIQTSIDKRIFVLGIWDIWVVKCFVKLWRGLKQPFVEVGMTNYVTTNRSGEKTKKHEVKHTYV